MGLGLRFNFGCEELGLKLEVKSLGLELGLGRVGVRISVVKSWD